MKKKRVKKVEKVKPQEVPTDEVTAKQAQPQKVNPFQAWDNLMFMRRPQSQVNTKEDK